MGRAGSRLALLAVSIVLLVGAVYVGGRPFAPLAQLRAARVALEAHDWREARRILHEYLERHPDDHRGHLLAARASRRLELLYEAGKHLDDCERVQGSVTPALEIERALLRVHAGELEAVEPFLRDRVASDDADAVEILDILSGALILAYRVSEAQACLDDLLRRQPDHFHALVRRAWTAQNQAWYPQAIEYLEKALGLRPDVDSVRLSLAELQVVVGRFGEAHEHFEKLRIRQPDNPSVLFGLARSLAGRGELDQALQLLDQVIARYPSDWKALGERGWLAVQLDHPAEGETYLRKALALAPRDLPLLTRLADCLRMLGREGDALPFREQAQRLKEDFARAQELGDEIRERRPDDPAPRHELATVLMRLGKVEDALHWYDTALVKDPGYRPTHQALLEWHEKAGHGGRAAFHRRALEETTTPPASQVSR